MDLRESEGTAQRVWGRGGVGRLKCCLRGYRRALRGRGGSLRWRGGSPLRGYRPRLSLERVEQLLRPWAQLRRQRTLLRTDLAF